MSGASLGGNPVKVRYLGNNDRPGGASLLGKSLDIDELRFAITYGNRQTRRLAMQTLARLQRQAAR